ncbi:MAG: hypothetical protein MJ069_09565 [Salinivirgaceae bacterium]|nr:hypothetical protein [Salinivirgaceae bacterium]
MKKLLIIAIAGLLFASCEKDEKEKTESDIIVKEYGEDYTLDLMKTGRNNPDTLYLDVNDDGCFDVMATLYHSSNPEPWKSFYPADSNVFIALGNMHEGLFYGDEICESTRWENDFFTWLENGYNDEVYVAVKFDTDTSVNYGWILPCVNQKPQEYQTMSIVKTAYCKTNGKTIFAGQEE